MSIITAVRAGTLATNLEPAPIHPDWILEGNPVARRELLFTSADGTATTLVWDCTAGRFNWYYAYDETVYVLEGGVTLKDQGNSVSVKAGDTVFFLAGTCAEWTVDSYIRKVAFCRFPIPKSLVLFKRIGRQVRRLIKGGATSNSPSPFL